MGEYVLLQVGEILTIPSLLLRLAAIGKHRIESFVSKGFGRSVDAMGECRSLYNKVTKSLTRQAGNHLHRSRIFKNHIRDTAILTCVDSTNIHPSFPIQNYHPYWIPYLHLIPHLPLLRLRRQTGQSTLFSFCRTFGYGITRNFMQSCFEVPRKGRVIIVCCSWQMIVWTN